MGGQSQPTTTQTSSVNLSPEQQQIFNLGLPYAQQYASTPVQQYQGSGIAGFNPLEVQAQQQTVNQSAPAVGALASQAASTQHQLLDPGFQLDVANNPYIQGAAQATTDQVTRNLNENILPQVRAGSEVSGGVYSGGATRQGIAEGKAIGATNTGLGEDLARMYLGAYTTGLGGLNQAQQNNPSVIQQQTAEPSILAGVGGQDRALEQAQLDEQIKKFYTNQSLPFLQAGDIMGLLHGMPGGSTTSTATGSVPSNPWAPLGLGISALGAAGGVPGVRQIGQGK